MGSVHRTDVHRMPFVIRRAVPRDVPALRDMQSRSIRELSLGFYDLHQVEAFLFYVGTLEEAVIEERNYFVAEIGGWLAGSGGWSAGVPRYFDVGAGVPAVVREKYVPRVRSVANDASSKSSPTGPTGRTSSKNDAARAKWVAAPPSIRSRSPKGVLTAS